MPCKELRGRYRNVWVLQYNVPEYKGLAITKCSSTECSYYHEALNDYAQNLVSMRIPCLKCLYQCVPTYTNTSNLKLVGWNDGAGKLKEATNFWHKVWEEAGRPSSGVLFNIKRSAMSIDINNILQDMLAHSFSRKRKDRFRSDIRYLM